MRSTPARAAARLAAAVKRIDAAPARSLGLAGRGMLQPEAFIDLVVLDPDRVIDQATFEQPTTRRREDGATKHGDPPRQHYAQHP